MRWQHWLSLFGRKGGTRTASGNVRPRLESLEARDVPTTFTNQAYVAALYQGFLGRSPSSDELTTWTNTLASGTPISQVASDGLHSTEYQGREVVALYQSILGRPADLTGLNGWVSLLQGGASLDQVKADILGSDEAFARAGSSGQGFLNTLYNDALGRAVDAQGQSLFGAQAAAGSAARTQVRSRC